jgi:hypothetical protein
MVGSAGRDVGQGLSHSRGRVLGLYPLFLTGNSTSYCDPDVEVCCLFTYP